MISEIFNFGVFVLLSLYTLILFRDLANVKILKTIVSILWLIGYCYSFSNLIQIFYLETNDAKIKLWICIINQILYSEYHLILLSLIIYLYIQTRFRQFSSINKENLMVLTNLQFIYFLLKFEAYNLINYIIWIILEVVFIFVLLKKRYIWDISIISFIIIYLGNSILLYFDIRPSITTFSKFMIGIVYKYALTLIVAFLLVYLYFFAPIAMRFPRSNVNTNIRKIIKKCNEAKGFKSTEALGVIFDIFLLIPVSLYRLFLGYIFEELSPILYLFILMGYSIPLTIMMMLYTAKNSNSKKAVLNLIAMSFSIHLISYLL